MAEPGACPSDETLLALVEGRLDGEAIAGLDPHLDGCPICREVVATLGSTPAASGPRPRAGAALERAEVVGRFVVLEAIGEGAMGVVYAAYDPELDRRVALKLLHAGDDAKGRARLTREAQALARLSHPNVVVVYDVGARGDEVYVAMELVAGQSLREWLRTPRERGAVLRALVAAGEGLAAAHAAGLVHRDFKPDNVLVDASGVPKVVDFGLARGAGEGAGPPPEGALLDATLTRTGALLGTPAYMAPEQLAGEPADARADQFAFCVTLWEALEGARPFEGETIQELRSSIAAGPPSARRMDRRTQSALRKGLAPSPADRHLDLDALLAALRPRPSRARPLALAAATAAFGLTAAWALADRFEDPCAASGAALAEVYAPPSLGGAVADLGLGRWASRWTAERVDACEDTHVRREQSPERLDRRMACLDRQRGVFEAVVEASREDGGAPAVIDAIEALPDPASCAIDAEVAPPEAAQAEAAAALRGELDRARVDLALAPIADAVTQAGRLRDAAEELGYLPLIADASRLAASALRAAARYDEAEDAAERGVLSASRAGDDRAEAAGWLERTRVAGARGRFDEAATWSRHADAAVARAGEPADLRGELWHLRGVVRTNLGQLEEAERDLRAALEDAEERFGAQSPRVAALHSSLGDLLRVDARYDEALAAHERALARDRAALGPNHPRVGRDLHNLAGVLRRMGRTAEARQRYERALAIKRTALGPEHPEVALTLNSLGLLAREAADRPAARARWEQALAIFDAHAHGDAALPRFNLALLDLDEGRFAEAEANVRAAIALDGARIGPRSKRVGSEHAVLARALAAQARADEAREAAALATAIASELDDPELAREARDALEVLAPTPPLELAPGPPAARGEAAGGAAPEAPTDEAAPGDATQENEAREDDAREDDAREGAGRRDAPAEEADPAPAAEESTPTHRPAGSGSYGASQAWE